MDELQSRQLGWHLSLHCQTTSNMQKDCPLSNYQQCAQRLSTVKLLAICTMTVHCLNKMPLQNTSPVWGQYDTWRYGLASGSSSRYPPHPLFVHNQKRDLPVRCFIFLFACFYFHVSCIRIAWYLSIRCLKLKSKF